MTLFWIPAIGLLALTGWMILPTLLGHRGDVGSDRAELNRVLHRRELAELDALRAGGEMDEPAYLQARAELERRVLESESSDGQRSGTAPPRLRRLTAATLIVVVPALAVVGYQQLGAGEAAMAGTSDVSSAQAVSPHAKANNSMSMTPVGSVEAMTTRLAQRLESAPDDPDGWLLLARSYHHLGRQTEAQAAYARARDHGAEDAELAALLASPAQDADTSTAESANGDAGPDLTALQTRVKAEPRNGDAWLQLAQALRSRRDFTPASEAFAQAHGLLPASADLLADYADVLAAANDRRLDGQPAELITQALTLDPDHPKALWLAATAALQHGDDADARQHWEHLLKVLPEGAPDRRIIERNLAALDGGLDDSGSEGMAAAGATGDAAPASVRGVVDISPELRARVSGDDTVFIFARAASGPPMPLAVLRKQVRDLPFEFVLDDSLAMQPQLKLSGFDQVMLGARVSRSGTVTQQPGEPRGDLGPVPTRGASGVQLLIDRTGS